MKWKLREVMDDNDDSMDSLAEHLGITYQTLSKKLNKHSDFTQTEIIKIGKRYDLSMEQMYDIFFS